MERFAGKQNKWAVRDWFEHAQSQAEKWNPLTSFAWMSDMGNKAWVTMTHLPFTGGRVGFGEAANYWRTYGAAQEDAFNRAVVHAFDSTVGMMVADDVLSASPEGVDAVKRIAEVLPESIDGATGRAGLADRLQSVIAGVQDPAVRARLQTYIGDFILKDYDTTLFASLRTGVKGANNVMLNPEYRKNIDDVMGNFFAFSYFTTRTAGNWAKRIVADPRALGWWARWEAASDQYAEQNEMPIRFQGMLPGPLGFMLSNPINFLLGINKMMAGSPPNPERAQNLGEMAGQAAGMFNLRFMPGWMAALSGDPRNLLTGFFPQGEIMGQAGQMAGWMGGIMINELYADRFAASRAGRAIGARTITTGQQDYDPQADALLAMQALFETMWGLEPKTEMTPGSEEALQYGKNRVAFEGMASSLSRFLVGYTIKAPIDPDEQSAMALSAILKNLMPQGDVGEWDPWKYVTAQWPGLQMWHAQGDLYPTDSGLPPQSEPADRIADVRPTPPMISQRAPNWFEWPVWDTQSGRLMESAQDTPFADPGDNTAIYMLVDPRTGRVHYVGQSVAPSERINQHIEEFDEKGWDHPKTAWIGDMLREGVTPEMYVFDWEPGSTRFDDDRADRVEQLWIGFLYYELGNRTFTDSTNVTIPEREVWEQLVKDSGLTKEQLRARFAQIQQDPATWDPVRLSGEPDLERSPFSGLFPSLPRPGTPQVETQKIAPDYGVNFGAYLPGEVGPKTTKALHEAGFMAWEDLANPANREKLVAMPGVSESDALAWMEHANLTLAVQRGEAIVPTDGRENEVPGQDPHYLVYPLTPAAEQAGEAGAVAAIAASPQGLPAGRSLVYIPQVSGGAAPQMQTAGLAGGVYRGDMSASPTAPGMLTTTFQRSTGASAFPTTPNLPPSKQTTLADLVPATQRSGTAKSPFGPGRETPFAAVAALGTEKQKSATVIDNGKRPTFAISSPFGEVAEWNSGQKPYTVLPSTRPTFDLERDASIAQHKQKAAETHAKFQEQFGPPNDPSVSAAGFMGVLSWIFTPSPEVATAKDFSGVYNYPERTRMEQDAGRRQERAYYDEVNKRTNTSLIAGAAAVASGVGYALIGGMVGTDNARLFWKGAGLGATWWAGANGYLGWDLGKKGRRQGWAGNPA